MTVKSIRYYYNKLAPSQKKIYEQMFQGLNNRKADIKVSSRFGNDDLCAIYEYVLLDNPQLFFVSDKIRITHHKPSIYKNICVSYLYSQLTANNMQTQIDRIACMLLSTVNYLNTGIDKLRSVYTFLAKNTTYNHNATAEKSADHNMVGPLLNCTAVCDGYARALKFLCDAIKIPCVVVSGAALSPHGGYELHAWNIVKVKGICYHLDVTWDSILEDMDHLDYFNLTDDEMAKDHKWKPQIMPRCDTAYSCVICVSSKREFERIFMERMSQGISSFQVRFSKRFENEREIIDMIRTFDLKTLCNVRVRYNITQNKAVIYLQ